MWFRSLCKWSVACFDLLLQRLTSSIRSTWCTERWPNSVRRSHVRSCPLARSTSTTGQTVQRLKSRSSVPHRSTLTTWWHGYRISWMMKLCFHRKSVRPANCIKWDTLSLTDNNRNVFIFVWIKTEILLEISNIFVFSKVMTQCQFFTTNLDSILTTNPR